MSKTHGRFAGTTRETATVHIPDDDLDGMDELSGAIDHNRSAEFRAAAQAWLAANDIFAGTDLADLPRAERIELIEEAVREQVGEDS